jgi:hypothetical protein
MMAREEMDIEEEEMDGYLEQILYDSDSSECLLSWYKLWEHFTIGFGILIAFGLVCVLQMVGNDLGKGFMMVLW